MHRLQDYLESNPVIVEMLTAMIVSGQQISKELTR
jgi:hypothetical protein